MTISEDFQFDLDGFTFGLHCALAVKEDGFDPGSASVRNQDQDMPSNDATGFGKDYLKGPSWSWSCYTDGEDVDDVRATIAALTTAWRNEAGRRVVGNVRALRYRIAGETRRVYGRPRNYAGPPTNLILGGRVDTAMTFDTADHLHYDDLESLATIKTTPASYSGYPLPSTWPWRSVNNGAGQSNTVQVGGDAATYPRIIFTASLGSPLINPKVVIGGDEYALTYTIPVGGSVTIDTRPWAQSVKRESGASVAGALTARTRIDYARLDPGNYVAAYTATDVSGNSTCTVAWRNAHNGL